MNGDPEGLCILTLSNGISMTGFYKKGIVFDGSGIYIYDDGTRYIGEWKAGKREGKGLLLDETGNILKTGQWEKDQFTQAAMEDSPQEEENEPPPAKARKKRKNLNSSRSIE